MKNRAMKLLSPESKSFMLELADAENRYVEIYVYHLPANQFNWKNGESSNENENEGNNDDNSEFVEGNNDDNSEFVEGNNDFNPGSEIVLRDEDRDCSDEEFMEIRKNFEQYGDRIRRNPNWKLVEMQDEFKRVLKVDVCEARCSRVRQKKLCKRVFKVDG
ncbi:hypothetical protein POM88_035243 [Heracleum sosnowskyi]|uniref:Uncharacterized protein n=1 Tax=Heracleum sosnowskyi TaxID=360622 RepID=A0AAD8MD22_9APIA|nr:hypothetical protein POM88_035243 [Heracleum sosnowskyi]